MSPVLNRPVGTGEAVPTSIRMPESMLKEIDAAAKEMDLSRSEAMLQLLRWALNEHEREMGREPKARTGPKK